LIVVDSSAIVAIMLRETNAGRLSDRIFAEPGCLLSVANYVESGQVLAQRQPTQVSRALVEFHELLNRLDVTLAPIDEVQARIALEARVRYGRGFGHRAKLNYSDCFAYALAKARDLPLLYVGDDFTHTDIVSALA
jgi:ribonuclease VapC